LKVLLDACVWKGALDTLVTAGHDVLWAGSWSEDPGDDQILSLAFQENRVLVTLDKGFGERAVVRSEPHCGIIRLVGIPARRQGPVALHLLEEYSADLAAGALITAETERVRVRRP